MTTQAQYSDVCLWGRNSTDTYSNNFINGLYRFESNYTNGYSETHPYYKLDLTSVADCSASYLFLFFGDDRTWTITANLGVTTAVYAICNDPAADTPEECSVAWNISTEAGYKSDENVELFSDNCPVLHCSSLSFERSDNNYQNCWSLGTLDIEFDQIGDNTYYKSENGFYWWFDPHVFQWFCYDTLSYSCSGHAFYNAFNSSSDENPFGYLEWFDFSFNDTVWNGTIENVALYFDGGGKTTDLICTGYGTTTTPAPTTPLPTYPLVPVVPPTASPVVTSAPTNAPTTDLPTRSPLTNGMTYSPTRSPITTENPTAMSSLPTQSPTIVTVEPSIAPTKSPTEEDDDSARLVYGYGQYQLHTILVVVLLALISSVCVV